MKAIAGIVKADEQQIDKEMSELSDEELVKALDTAAWLKSTILTAIRDRGLAEGI